MGLFQLPSLSTCPPGPSAVNGAEITGDVNFNTTGTKFMQHNKTILSVFQDVALSS